MTPLEIFANGQRVTTLRLAASLGRAHFSRVHADSKFFSNEQFKLAPSGTGWVISPVAGSVNPTLVERLPLTGPQAVIDGMTISVRGAAGLSIVLKCSSPDSPAMPAVPAAAAGGALPPVTASAPVATPAPAPSASPSRTFLSRTASMMRAGAGRIGNWFRSGGGAATAAGAGALFTALFTGLLAASSRSSNGDGQTKIREGDSQFGRVILTIDGDRVRRGDSSFGEVLMRFDGNRIRQGDSCFGRIVATVDGDRVRAGDSSYGQVIAKIDGNRIRQGDSSYGAVIATTRGGRMSAAAAAVWLLLT